MAKIVEIISVEKKAGKVIVHAKNDAGITVFKEVSETDPIADMLFAEASEFKAKQTAASVNQTSSTPSIKPVSEDHYCYDGLTLYDVHNLVISGSDRLDPTGEYDISYYENYVNQNVIILDELIKKVKEQILLVKDERMRDVLSNRIKGTLQKVYDKSKNKDVITEYLKATKYHPEESDPQYFKSHKYVRFIMDDIARYIRDYSLVVDFLSNTYRDFVVANHKQSSDALLYWNIFVLAKEACSMLGIHCLSEKNMYDIVSNPAYIDGTYYNKSVYSINEESSFSEDVIIDKLPYAVTIPIFTFNGPNKIEFSLPGSVSYNKSYYDKKVNNVR